MKSRLMPVAKITRHSDTSIARDKLLFRRLGSIGSSVRFVFFPILIDAPLLSRSGKPQVHPVLLPSLFNLVQTGWEPQSTSLMIRGRRVGCRVAAKGTPYYPALTLISRGRSSYTSFCVLVRNLPSRHNAFPSWNGSRGISLNGP